jgi:hypothetical protein
MYGRGVSTEVNSPPPEKPKIGGPQPTLEQLPVLFDKVLEWLSSLDPPKNVQIIIFVYRPRSSL